MIDNKFISITNSSCHCWRMELSYAVLPSSVQHWP